VLKRGEGDHRTGDQPAEGLVQCTLWLEAPGQLGSTVPGRVTWRDALGSIRIAWARCVTVRISTAACACTHLHLCPTATTSMRPHESQAMWPTLHEFTCWVSPYYLFYLL